MLQLKYAYIFFAFILSLLFTSFSHATELENIQLQLRWHHQYQFAGYYAAKHKGFYKEAGFDVNIISGSSNIQPTTELLAGRADFAVGNSAVLMYRLNGEPIVALAAIFQHSPSILLTLASSNITKAEQLKNKNIMLLANSDVDLIAMLRAAGVKENQVNIQKSSYQLNDLVNQTTDAFNSYRTNEPFYLEELGIEYNIISPSDYNIDFYSDILFTSEARIQADPESVERFKQATLKGWRYAVDHSEEVIQIINQHYNQSKSLNHMRYEALTVNNLVKSDLIPIGHIFEQRINKMADIFIEQNMVLSKEALDGFIFKIPESMNKKFYIWLLSAGFIGLFFLTVLLLILRMNWQLKKEIKLRIKGEEQLNVLANTDSLTALLNRRAFINEFEKYQSLSSRYKQSFCIALLDIDNFKKINDTYGHDIGDEVLIKATELLKSTLRDVDICARFGGEEFIILLPNTTLAQAEITLERIRHNFEKNELSYNHKQTLKFTASFGFTESRNESFEELLKKVDHALYTAKSAGKNKIIAAS